MLTAERLRELLHYDPETGVFTRLVRTSNNTRGGDIVGWSSGHGYRWVMLDGRLYPTHRLAFLWTTGRWPKDQVDHINMDRIDNRWCNLREATSAQNQGNTRALSNKTSDFKGVYWDQHMRKWRARVGVNGKLIHLGYFDKPHVAYSAYCLAARKYFGEYARVYEADQLIIPRKVFEERVLRNLLAATQCQFEEAA